MSWNEKRTRERVREAWKATAETVVKPLVREASLEDLSLTTAYRVDGVHVYVDVPNAPTLVGLDSEQEHRRLLRFLHIFMRVAYQVFQRTDGVKVDLQNSRLHFIVYKPYDSESARVAAAVAIAALLRDALLAGNALHAELPDARAVIGIESGISLAVRNGTRGDREPLFLGNPANRAAKLTGPTRSAGIYLGAAARSVLGGAFASASPADPLTAALIVECVEAAKLGVTTEDVSKAWDDERKARPLSEFAFTRWAPPLAGCDLEALSPKNSKRQELVVLYADVDGFTQYIADAVATGAATGAVRVLHVIRKELRDVLHEFGGRKVRYIGDCVQGVLAEGTAHKTDAADSVVTAALCAAAMRSAFGVIQSELAEAGRLGIQIGLEYGPSSVSRVGVQGSRDRCVVGLATLEAERAQASCAGTETAIGPAAYDVAPPAIRDAFGVKRKSNEIDYDRLAIRLDRADAAAARRHGVCPTFPDPIRPRAFSD